MTQKNIWQIETSSYQMKNENSSKDIDDKIAQARISKARIGYSWGWIIFWFILFFLIGLIISTIIAFANHNKRTTFFELEIHRLENIKKRSDWPENLTTKFEKEEIDKVLSEIEKKEEIDKVLSEKQKKDALVNKEAKNNISLQERIDLVEKEKKEEPKK